MNTGTWTDEYIIDFYDRDSISFDMFHYHCDKRFIIMNVGGEEIILRPFSIVETIKDTFEEDWKTAIVHHIPYIPKGERLKVVDVLQNLYGTFLEVSYNNRIYSVSPRNCKYIEGPKDEELRWKRIVK